MGKSKIKKPKGGSSLGRIPESALNHPTGSENADEQHPSFRFEHTDQNRWCLSEWNSSEIDDLIRALKKIERYTWAQIKSQGSKQRGGSVGCGYKLITNHPKLPESISDDVKLSEMRVDERKRIFGFRVGSIYYIVWFDRDHSVCPE